MFYTIVVIIAAILLVVVLVLMYYLMTSAKDAKSAIYPPLANSCPDFWMMDPSSNSCILPRGGESNLGTFPVNPTSSDLNATPKTFGYSSANNVKTINFGDGAWASTGVSSLCAKNKWAGGYGISWDGVSNYSGTC